MLLCLSFFFLSKNGNSSPWMRSCLDLFLFLSDLPSVFFASAFVAMRRRHRNRFFAKASRSLRGGNNELLINFSSLFDGVSMCFDISLPSKSLTISKITTSSASVTSSEHKWELKTLKFLSLVLQRKINFTNSLLKQKWQKEL